MRLGDDGQREIASERLYGPGVGNEHDDERDEERHERRVDGERAVEYAARARAVPRHHQHVTCTAEQLNETRMPVVAASRNDAKIRRYHNTIPGTPGYWSSTSIVPINSQV